MRTHLIFRPFLLLLLVFARNLDGTKTAVIRAVSRYYKNPMIKE